MTEIIFYYLSVSSKEEILPPLLERCIERGWRVLISCGNVERRDMLNQYLWTYRDDSFLPHAIESDPNAQDQPILLTVESIKTNNPHICFLLEPVSIENLSSYIRVAYFFDTHDVQQIDKAKAYWKAFSEQSYKRTAWEQSVDKKWKRK